MYYYERELNTRIVMLKGGKKKRQITKRENWNWGNLKDGCLKGRKGQRRKSKRKGVEGFDPNSHISQSTM